MNHNDLHKYLSAPLRDKKWKTSEPVFNLADSFDFFSGTIYTSDLADTLGMLARQEVLRYYPNLPQDAGKLCYMYDYKHVIPYKQSLAPSEKLTASFLDHVRTKLQSSKVFPFPAMFSYDEHVLARVQHGFALYLHDVYKPIKVLQATKPTTFNDYFVGTMTAAPTVTYEETPKVADYFPVEFMLCFPLFTLPRLSFPNATCKFSVLDLYLPDQLEHHVRAIANTHLAHIIEAIYLDNEPMAKLAKKMMLRAKMVCGNMRRDIETPRNFQTFMLERSKLRLSPPPYEHTVFLEARNEVRRRAQQDKESDMLSAVKELITKSSELLQQER